MRVTLDDLKRLLTPSGVVWVDVGSSNPAVANGYFMRTTHDGQVFKAPLYLNDKSAVMVPLEVELVYRRLKIVPDDLPN